MRRSSTSVRICAGTLALILGVAMLSACGSSSSTPKASAEPTSTATPEPTDTPFVPATVAPPPAGWSRITVTELGFAFDYPADWVGGKVGVRSALVSADGHASIFWVVNTAPEGGTLDEYKTVNIASFGVEPEWQDAVSIGGTEGWGVELHATSMGSQWFTIDYFTVHGGRSFDLIMMTKPGTEAADRQLYRQIESTFAFSS
jgi:hypothetical protein